MSESTFYGTGRRKRSVARVYLSPGKGNIKASRVSAKTVGDLTIDLIHDIDQDVIDNIDSKVKEWQSKSSYDGNYFEWKAKK